MNGGRTPGRWELFTAMWHKDGDARGSWEEPREDQKEVVLWEGVDQCNWMLSGKLEMIKVYITCGKVGKLMENKSVDSH